MSTQWKHSERRVATLFGGQRVGHLGGADVTCDWASVEVKHKKALPGWMVHGLAQARRNSLPHQLPVLVLHIAGQRHLDNFVVLRMSDFIDHFGELPP